MECLIHISTVHVLVMRIGFVCLTFNLVYIVCLQLAAIKLARYGEDLLFYLYYMNGGDLLQLLAAVELYA